MRKVYAPLLALALASCAGAYGVADHAPAAPAVHRNTPGAPISMEAANSILFWDDAHRSAAFRSMESMSFGLEVAPSAHPRELSTGTPLSNEAQKAIHDLVERTHAAGVMVLQDGRVRYEQYALGFEPTGRWTSFSVAKSITSTLLGAAIADGHIASLDVPVADVLPELAGTAYEGVTVGQIATMTSGVKWNEDYTDPKSDVANMLAIAPVAGESQAVTYARKLTREAPAGKKWVYKTLETNLLGLIVEKATGQPLAEYAAKKIVDPVGFAGGLFWMQDATGGNIGGCCLSLRLSDYARFGQFVLDGGHGVVPQGWFEDAGAAKVDFGPEAPGFGYGYQWWAYPDGNFGAQGIFGQGIMIVPEHKLVVAYVSNWPTASHAEYRESWRRLIPAITGDHAAN